MLALVVGAVIALTGPALAVDVGDPAPAIDVTAVTNVPDNLDRLDGKVVLVNFWASWCGPCRAELPDLAALQQRLDHHEATVLAVNIDRNEKNADRLLERAGVDLPVVYDQVGALAAGYQPPVMPTTYLIDRTGKVRRVYEGRIEEAQIASVEAEILSLVREEEQARR